MKLTLGDKGRKSPIVRWGVLLITLTLVLVVGFLLVQLGLNARARGPVATPTVTRVSEPSVQVSPIEGESGAMIVATGEGWQPGDNVTLRLDALTGDAEDAIRIFVAFAETTEYGRFTAPFLFPSDERLVGVPYVLVTAYSPATGDEAFSVLWISIVETPAPEPSAIPTVPPPTPALPTPADVEVRPSATPQPSPTPTPASVACVDKATFVSDVTVPDNAYFLPGQAFVKTWRLRNGGTCTWSTDYALVFASGHRMGGSSPVPLQRPVAPGSAVDLSVSLVAPADYGTYEGRWQLRNADGASFGTGDSRHGAFWVRINVGVKPSPTPTPTPTPPLPVTAWRGEYYNNRFLTGNPVVVRNDLAIDFNWSSQAPAAGLPADEFSARWTRVLWFEEGQYRFHAVMDDGMRLWVDDALVIDSWRDGGRREVTAERWLSTGNHSLRVEYYERAGEALARVWWERLASYPDWKGEYWSNRKLHGGATLTRNDEVIDFRWGSGSPASRLPTNDFSARWTRRVTFKPGTYRLYALADDGVRVYVEGKLVLDEWHASSGDEVYTVDLPLRNERKLVVEYYERDGNALVRFWWKRIGDWPVTPTPTPTPTPVVNRPPLAANDAVTGDEDTTIAFNVLTNDSDPDGDKIVVSKYDTVSARGGSVSCTKAGACTYTPRANFNGSDRFAYTISDGKGKYATATVVITVKPVNDPPVAVNDNIATNEDTPVAINVLANDSDPDGDALVVSSYDITSAQGGMVSCTGDGMCTYTPRANFNGDDSFAYTVSDGKGKEAKATVAITVKPVNDPPVAVDDVVTTDEDTPATFDVLTNDSDPDGDTLVVSGFDTVSVQSGVVSCADDGICTYTPPAGFNGEDRFTYTISDGQGKSATATVFVTVRAVNQPPVAVDDAATTGQDMPVTISVLANDLDPDGDALIVGDYDAVSAQGGTVKCTDDVCTYTPPQSFNGEDRFTYVVSDGNALVGDVIVGTVVITVTV